MDNQLEIFHFDKNKTSFENFCRKNDIIYWYARDLMLFLGYYDYKGFKRIINKAISACMTLDIDVSENFKQIERDIEGKKEKDYKLSRFACYLAAMNGDTKKQKVAQAQAYFVAIAESFRNYLEEARNIERVLIRNEVTDREKTLSGTANERGVYNYPLFQNAGYRGLYNMNLNDLKNYKGFDKKGRTLLDFMGKEELAANLFRLTQTELKIKKENIKGQKPLEAAAEIAGVEVRKTMKQISNILPEDLELVEDIKKVKTSIKRTHKKFLKQSN
ncbi:MAG: damage-inducible protein D [Deltaproteobacteria bacterium]|nr:damage-inducible protein D [Deltaproteobacteria bacterium]